MMQFKDLTPAQQDALVEVYASTDTPVGDKAAFFEATRFGDARAFRTFLEVMTVLGIDIVDVVRAYGAKKKVG